MAESRIDRRALARSFDRASRGYDAVARLQAEVRTELLDRLQYLKTEPLVVLDLGAGTAHATRELRQRYPRALVIAADLAPGMLREARGQSKFMRRFERVCADAYRLPFADASVDLLFSSLMLQWCDDLDGVLAEISRVVKPGGVFTFSSFGPDTLRELRAAWARVDKQVHVNQFIDMHDVGDAVGRAGFANPVLDVDRHRAEYGDVRALMRDLKALGAHNVAAGRARGLTGRSALERLTAAYEVHRHDGKLPATYEVIYGTAWERDHHLRLPPPAKRSWPFLSLGDADDRLNRGPMVPVYFITGTDTEVGKTWCSVILVRALQLAGARVAVMKPIACGCDDTVDGPRNADALALIAASNVVGRYAQVNPYCLRLPASPHLAAEAEGVRIDLAVLECCATELTLAADLLVVEGAGGWLAPINQEDTMAAVARALRSAVILVVGLRLGCLNHALLTSAAIRASGLALAGWIANHLDPAFEYADANVATLRQRLGAPLLGVIHHGSNGESAARSLDTTLL